MQGTLTEGEGFRAIGLLIKVACFVTEHSVTRTNVVAPEKIEEFENHPT